MQNYIIPTQLKKIITFRRLPIKAVSKYLVYATFKDDAYTSGLKTELIDTIINPSEPSPVLKRIELEYNINATWSLPADAYLDRDHQFRLYLNNFVQSNMYYRFNRLSKLITFDTAIKSYTVNDKMELEYYQDMICKGYMLNDDCTIEILPIFNNSYNYGFHNIII